MKLLYWKFKSLVRSLVKVFQQVGTKKYRKPFIIIFCIECTLKILNLRKIFRSLKQENNLNQIYSKIVTKDFEIKFRLQFDEGKKKKMQKNFETSNMLCRNWISTNARNQKTKLVYSTMDQKIFKIMFKKNLNGFLSALQILFKSIHSIKCS
jgi:hypothetical protein